MFTLLKIDLCFSHVWFCVGDVKTFQEQNINVSSEKTDTKRQR